MSLTEATNTGSTQALPGAKGSFELKPLRELGKIVTGSTPSTAEPENYGGVIPFLKPTDLNVGYTIYSGQQTLTDKGVRSARLLPPMSVLVTCIGATIGKTGLCRVTCATNQQINAVCTNSFVLPEYVYWYLNGPTAQEWIKENASATTLPILNKSRFGELPVPVPPLQHQSRIVEQIETQLSRLEAGVSALKRAQANLKRYRAAILKAACEGRLVPTEAELARVAGRSYEDGNQLISRILEDRRRSRNGRGKYKEPKAPSVSGLGQLPEGWIWASVEQLTSKVVDGVHKKPSYVSTGVPFVTVRNLTAGPGISLERLNYITREDHSEFIKRANPERGDVLISKDGTLGVVRVIETEAEFSIFVSVALIKPVERTMGRYLGHALSSPQVQQQMVPKGSGLQHIHLEDLREDCVPLPPLVEQERIVTEVERYLSVVGELESTITTNLRRATHLRQSILSAAFQRNC